MTGSLLSQVAAAATCIGNSKQQGMRRRRQGVGARKEKHVEGRKPQVERGEAEPQSW